MAILLYSAVVLIWGSTWLAIANQVGDVPVAASVCYRSAGAALILFAYLAVRRQRLRFPARDHLPMAAIGALMFSCNYLFLYNAEDRIPSGLVALLFAMTLPFNVINEALILKRRVTAPVLGAVAIGISGIAVMFWSDIASVRLSGTTLIGAALALGGTLCFSLGNIVSIRSQAAGVPVVQSEAYGLLYGALLLVPVTLLTGGFRFSATPAYTVSLGYLVVFGSIVGFAFYLTILGRTSAAHAGYITVSFPVVALLWSTLFEHYRWSANALVGALLILIGCTLTVRSHNGADPGAPQRAADDVAIGAAHGGVRADAVDSAS